jgi:uracil-DNA glycosylase family 4
MTDSLSISPSSSHASPLTAQDYWTADQLKVMQGLGLPAWFRPVTHEPSDSLSDSLSDSKGDSFPLVPTHAVPEAALPAIAALSAQTALTETVAVQALVSSDDSAATPFALNALEVRSAGAVFTQTVAPPLTLPRAPVAWLVIANSPLGEAAQALWVNMLASVGKRPEDAYVLPLLPPSSTETDPFSDVVQTGLAAVQAHITALQPQLLVTMGTLAAQAMLGVEDELTGFAGELHEYEGLPLLVMQHPEALLKQPQLKAQAWRDLNLV